MNVGQIGKLLPGWFEHVVACAGPRPVGWFLTETASHGVHMDIVYGRLQCFDRIDISIISRPFLPSLSFKPWLIAEDVREAAGGGGRRETASHWLRSRWSVLRIERCLSLAQPVPPFRKNGMAAKIPKPLMTTTPEAEMAPPTRFGELPKRPR